MDTQDFISQKERVRAFMHEEGHGVLATVLPNGEPHAATITFLLEDDFTMHFLSHQSTKKFVALQKYPTVALTVGVHPEKMTVQIHGKAEVVEGSGRDEMIERFLVESATTYSIFLKMGERSDISVVKIVPTWLRSFEIIGEQASFVTLIGKDT